MYVTFKVMSHGEWTDADSVVLSPIDVNVDNDLNCSWQAGLVHGL